MDQGQLACTAWNTAGQLHLLDSNGELQMVTMWCGNVPVAFKDFRLLSLEGIESQRIPMIDEPDTKSFGVIHVAFSLSTISFPSVLLTCFVLPFHSSLWESPKGS